MIINIIINVFGMLIVKEYMYILNKNVFKNKNFKFFCKSV